MRTCQGACVPQPDPSYHPALPWPPVRDEVCAAAGLFFEACRAHVGDVLVRWRQPPPGRCYQEPS